MEESDSHRRAAIIAEIEKAFDGVSREGGISLRQARLYDDDWTPSEENLAQALREDTDRRWQDVPDKWIEEYSDTLIFLCPKSFNYYLPAFMCYALRHYMTCDGSWAGVAAIEILDTGGKHTPVHACEKRIV